MSQNTGVNIEKDVPLNRNQTASLKTTLNMKSYFKFILIGFIILTCAIFIIGILGIVFVFTDPSYEVRQIVNNTIFLMSEVGLISIAIGIIMGLVIDKNLKDHAKRGLFIAFALVLLSLIGYLIYSAVL